MAEAPAPLPCPFCGGTTFRSYTVTHGHGDFGKGIECQTCGVRMPDSYMGPSAFEKWNSRGVTNG